MTTTSTTGVITHLAEFRAEKQNTEAYRRRREFVTELADHLDELNNNLSVRRRGLAGMVDGVRRFVEHGDMELAENPHDQLPGSLIGAVKNTNDDVNELTVMFYNTFVIDKPLELDDLPQYCINTFTTLFTDTPVVTAAFADVDEVLDRIDVDSSVFFADRAVADAQIGLFMFVIDSLERVGMKPHVYRYNDGVVEVDMVHQYEICRISIHLQQLLDTANKLRERYLEALKRMTPEAAREFGEEAYADWIKLHNKEAT